MNDMRTVLTEYEAALQEDIQEGGDEAANALENARTNLLNLLRASQLDDSHDLALIRAALEAACLETTNFRVQKAIRALDPQAILDTLKKSGHDT